MAWRKLAKESSWIESIFLRRTSTGRGIWNTRCFLRITVLTVPLVTLRNTLVIHACLPRRKTERDWHKRGCEHSRGRGIIQTFRTKPTCTRRCVILILQFSQIIRVFFFWSESEKKENVIVFRFLDRLKLY